MPNKIISIYLEEMEERLEAPYRRGVIVNFIAWCVVAIVGSFYLMVLL